MKIKELKDADFSLVYLKRIDSDYPSVLVEKTDNGLIVIDSELNSYPHCKIHGAMNKLTKDGIWRCMASYKLIPAKQNPQNTPPVIQENTCKAGCEEIK